MCFNSPSALSSKVFLSFLELRSNEQLLSSPEFFSFFFYVEDLALKERKKNPQKLFEAGSLSKKVSKI